MSGPAMRPRAREPRRRAPHGRAGPRPRRQADGSPFPPPQRPPPRRGGLAVRRERQPVPGELGKMVVELGGPVRLQRVGGASVPGDEVGCRDGGPHGIAGEGVREPELAPAHLSEKARPDRQVGHAQALRHRHVEHVRHHRDREPAPDDRGGLDEPARRRRESVDAAVDRLADGPRRVLRCPRPRGDGARHLADEEGISTRGVAHRGRCDAGRTELIELAADIGLVQARQVQPLDVRGSVQVRERSRERAVRFGVAQCGQQQQRCAGGAVGEVAQYEQRGLVGPVDVVDHEHQRPPAGRVEDRGSGSVDGAEPVLGRRDLRRRQVGNAQRPEHLPPRPERRGAVRVDAVPPRHGGKGRGVGVRRRAAGEHAQLLCETGLSDTALADEEHEASPTGDGAVQPCVERRQLMVAAEQRRADGSLRHAGQHAAPSPPCQVRWSSAQRRVVRYNGGLCGGGHLPTRTGPVDPVNPG